MGICLGSPMLVYVIYVVVFVFSMFWFVAWLVRASVRVAGVVLLLVWVWVTSTRFLFLGFVVSLLQVLFLLFVRGLLVSGVFCSMIRDGCGEDCCTFLHVVLVVLWVSLVSLLVVLLVRVGDGSVGDLSVFPVVFLFSVCELI